MIDAGNDPWPEEVTNFLPALRQGSLLTRPPFGYQANTLVPVWAASKLSPEKGPDVGIELELDDRPPYGIVTTQSCDVDEGGINKKPWIQLAPVYELPEDDPRLGSARLWRVNYLVPIPTLGERWFGDLRIEIPVEKSWLVGQNHLDAYVDQRDFDRFSEHVGNYKGRPAMATSVYDLVLTPLSQFVTSLHGAEPALYTDFNQRVTDLFVELAGDSLNPTAVGLIFVSDAALPDALTEALDGWWEDQMANLNNPFIVVGNRYQLAAGTTLSDLRWWIRQDLARIAGS